jgi:hypothetical protein
VKRLLLVTTVSAAAGALILGSAQAAVQRQSIRSTTVLSSPTPSEGPIVGTLTAAAPQPASVVTADAPPAAAGAAVAASCTIWFQPGWSLRMESLLWGIAWNETQKGAYYYGCGYVWQKSRLGWDTSGWHRCGYSSGFGFSIDVKSCYKVGDPSTSQMRLGDQFKVSAIVSGFPISATHEMAVCAGPGGGLSTCVWN